MIPIKNMPRCGHSQEAHSTKTGNKGLNPLYYRKILIFYLYSELSVIYRNANLTRVSNPRQVVTN